MPVLLAEIPPLTDYPGHLARVAILVRLLTGEDTGGMYALSPAVIPNLAIDGIVVGLVRLGFPIEAAGRIFLALTLAVLACGTWALHRAVFRRASAIPLFAIAFLYGDTLIWGFVNYIFGVGIALCGAAAWEVARRRSLVRAAVLLALFGVAAFFAHLLAALLLFGIVLATEAARLALRQEGSLRRMGIALSAALPVVVFIMLMPVTHGTAPPRLAGLQDVLAPAALAWRLREIANFAVAYDRNVDLASLGLLAAGAAWAVLRRRLAIFPPLLLPLAGLAAIYLVIPDNWYGTAFLPDRLPMVLFALALASVDVPDRHGVVAALALVLILLRTAVVADAWIAANRAYAPIVAYVSRLTPDQRIYAAIAYQRSHAVQRRLPRTGLANYATIRAGAFSAGVFAVPTQNIVRQAGPGLSAPASPPPYRTDIEPASDYSPYTRQRLGFYDRLLVINPELLPFDAPSWLAADLRGPDYVIYRIPHPAPARISEQAATQRASPAQPNPP
jgi:hypothetical protein